MLKRVLLPERETLPRGKSASLSKDGMLPSSLGESYSNIPSCSSCFPLFSCCSTKSEPSLFPVWQSADTPLRPMFTPSRIFCMTGSWQFRLHHTRNLNLSDSASPNGLSSLSPLWLHFQTFLRNLTPWKVDLCDAQPSEYSPRPVSCNSTG